MLFRRRQKPGLARRLSDLVWPRSGWSRAARYVGHRLARLPGTPYGIAAGFACGAASSVLPLVGAHFILAALAAWAIRANVVASAIGTVVGNPWTFPAIWWSTYWLGDWILGDASPAVSSRPDFVGMFTGLWQAVIFLDLQQIGGKIWPVLAPMLVGSIPLSIITGIAFYIPLRRLVASYQHLRLTRRLSKVAVLRQASKQEGQ
ncbi:DUF2062 domain-containing protein [Telmatospirillum sp. J64-1]|uniref:DUF2062 domain-containing protein n=1 Tax=Telmatospirillum sp. J64-1 TaxID=2502183 RepID=UPI00115D0D8E|nr:DUF2062 domain-containing protein [Telmatospirillum sp. J64-1]